MSTDTALTMEELELETAELLPSRETLCACVRPSVRLPPVRHRPPDVDRRRQDLPVVGSQSSATAVGNSTG